MLKARAAARVRHLTMVLPFEPDAYDRDLASGALDIEGKTRSGNAFITAHFMRSRR